MNDEEETLRHLIDHLFAQAKRNREDPKTAKDTSKEASQGNAFNYESLKNSIHSENLEEQLSKLLKHIGKSEDLEHSLASILPSLKLTPKIQELVQTYLQQHPIESLVEQAQEELRSIQVLQDLEITKAQFLGPNGHIRSLLKALQQVPAEKRPAIGQRINAIKIAIEALFETKTKELSAKSFQEKLPKPIDISLNPRIKAKGSLHPLTLLRERIYEIFHRMGYTIAEGSELESEWFCFDALNTPPDHPARKEQDTFYLPQGIQLGNIECKHNKRYILRSQTSTVQIRTMLQESPPLRIISSGRVFRRDTSDATHSTNFHQCEGLYVDRKASIVDLKSTIFFFFQELFGKTIEIRFRPSFFPFTEPSFEVDIRSPKLGKLSTRWIEILGCGMVDPEVFHAVHYDPEAWTGFAFALGLERVAMFLYGIDDIRHFYRNDQRFLQQFA